MKKTRIQIFKDLNVNPTNERWAWCAKDDKLKIAVFTLWEDEEREDNSWILHDEHSKYKKNGYYDQERILIKCIEDNYEALGVICVAKNIKASPRSIKEIKDDFLVKLKLEKKGEKIFGEKIGEVSFLERLSKTREAKENDAISDLLAPPIGIQVPDRAIVTGYSFKRDSKVRNYVIQMADGKCEYCQSETFAVKGGSNFLEAHHIISLANQGNDSVDNVIALCPNHHREAHYGINGAALEKEFVQIIKNRTRPSMDEQYLLGKKL